jgi:general secretion pathway protein H
VGPLTTRRARPRALGNDLARRSALRGFTLVEILVVVVIIALTAGLAVMAYDGNPRGVAIREATRLAGALEHAAQSAQVRAETLGVSADGGHWQFWRRPDDANAWLPVTDDDVLAPHTLPQGLAVLPLAYAGQPLGSDAIVPLHASGHNEPYAFALTARDTRVVLAADPLNRVAVQAVDAP